MIEAEVIPRLHDALVLAANGVKIGTVSGFHLDPTGATCLWITVRTGLFGNTQVLVPAELASASEGDIQLSVEKATVKGAPRVTAEGPPNAADSEKLYRHYGVSAPDVSAVTTGVAATDTAMPNAAMPDAAFSPAEEGTADAIAEPALTPFAGAATSVPADETAEPASSPDSDAAASPTSEEPARPTPATPPTSGRRSSGDFAHGEAGEHSDEAAAPGTGASPAGTGASPAGSGRHRKADEGRGSRRRASRDAG